MREPQVSFVAAMVAEQAPGDSRSEAMFTDKAILEGKGVVDLGCTDTMVGGGAIVHLTSSPGETWRNTATPGSRK